MKPLGDYAEKLKDKDFTQYVAENPPAVFLIDAFGTKFHAISGDPGDTMLRLEPGFNAGGADEGMQKLHGTPKSVAYMVVAVEPDSKAIADGLLLGCGEQCDVRIDETSVSREHARIRRKQQDYFISDCNSTGGTYINGKQLAPGRDPPLKPGNRVTLGSLDLTFLDAAGFYHFVKRFMSD